MRLYGTLSVQKFSSINNTWMPLTAEDRGKVTLINHYADALFKSITVTVNGAVVTFVNTTEYPFKAWLENITTFSPEAAKNQLSPSGYLPETLDMFDDITKGGNKTRSEYLTTKNGKIGFSTPLHCDIFQHGRIMMDNCGIQLDCERSSDNFLLLTDSTSIGSGDVPTKYRVALHECRLSWKKISIRPEIKHDIDSALSTGKRVRYPINRVMMKWAQIPQKTQDFSYNLVSHNNMLPYMIVCGLFREKSMLGETKSTPFNVMDYKVDSFEFKYNEVSLPHSMYAQDNSNDDNMSYLRNYAEFIDNINAGRYNSANLITPEMWRKHYHFVSFWN